MWWLYYLLPLLQPLGGLNSCTNLPMFFLVKVLFVPVLLFFFSPCLLSWCWLSIVLSNDRYFWVTALISACSMSRKIISSLASPKVVGERLQQSMAFGLHTSVCVHCLSSFSPFLEKANPKRRSWLLCQAVRGKV